MNIISIALLAGSAAGDPPPLTSMVDSPWKWSGYRLITRQSRASGGFIQTLNLLIDR